MAMEGAAADLVKSAGAGIVVAPEDPAELAKAMQELSEMSLFERIAMGQRGQTHLRQHLSKAKVIAQYESVLEGCAKRNAGRE